MAVQFNEQQVAENVAKATSGARGLAWAMDMLRAYSHGRFRSIAVMAENLTLDIMTTALQQAEADYVESERRIKEMYAEDRH